MVLNNIEQLLEKYDNAETSLKEEAQLRAYFKSDNVAEHLEHYRPMFTYFSQSQKEQFTKDVSLNTKKTKRFYQWISVAAVTVLMLGIAIPNWGGGPKTLAEYTPEEQKMYTETKNALAMLSNTFNNGASSYSNLSLVSENFNAGIEKASHISAFSEITNNLLKN